MIQPDDDILYKNARILANIMKVGYVFGDVPNHAASTVRGNLAVTSFIGDGKADHIGIEHRIMGEMHLVMRSTIGMIGKKMDHDRLPKKLRATIGRMDDAQQEYRAIGGALRGKIDGMFAPVPEYGDLGDITELVKNLGFHHPHTAECRAIMRDMTKKNVETDAIIKNIRAAFDDTRYIFFKNDDTPVPNAKLKNDHTFGEWLYCAEHGAKAFADTLKISDAFSDMFSSVLGNTKTIITDMCDNLQNNPALQHQAVMDPLEQVIPKLRRQIVKCADYAELNGSYPVIEFSKALDITTQADYNAIADQQAGKKAAQAAHMGGGRCPFGFDRKAQP